MIDLGGATLMPGLIDAHTHVFLNDDVGPGVYDEILLKKSTPYRAIEAVANARRALAYGFTSLRDLETEGAMYADVDVKTAIAQGRRARAADVRRDARARADRHVSAARLQLGADDADWRADRRRRRVDPQGGARASRSTAPTGSSSTPTTASTRARPDRPVRSIVNFTPAEAAAIVDEAHRLGVKVAAHANGWDGIDSALRAGVDSLEHGQGLTDDLSRAWSRRRSRGARRCSPTPTRRRSSARTRGRS